MADVLMTGAKPALAKDLAGYRGLHWSSQILGAATDYEAQSAPGLMS
jgi:hypothetical protein